ncbi:MAG: FHA domain-containing protein, partial [Anaerolineae bacterium]
WLAGAAVMGLLAMLLLRPVELLAAPASAPWQQLPPAPSGEPPPVATVTPTCVPVAPVTGAQLPRQFIFINGWDREDLLASRLPWTDTVSTQPIEQWDALKAALKTEAGRVGEPLTDDGFHHYSYRGEHEQCDTRRHPLYSARDTRFRADEPGSLDPDASDRSLYDQRSEYISAIVRRYPGSRFVIVGHSLGGAVAMYWAGTAPDGLVSQVDFIATLGSPLGGQPLGCFQGDRNLTPWLPSLVHDEITRAPSRARVLTVRNSHDSVVKPEAATVFDFQGRVASTVWRDLKSWLAGPIDEKGDLSPNLCEKSGHTELAGSDRVIQTVVDAAFPGSVVALDGKPVAGLAPVDIGPSDHPRPIELVLRWPSDGAVVKQLRSGQAGDVAVRVDGVAAKVTSVTDLLPIENNPELLRDSEHHVLHSNKKPLQGYHRFQLRVQPPQRSDAGIAGLSITVGGQEDQIEAALRYLPPDRSGTDTGGDSQTIMVIDASGSMAEDDASGSSKIAAARRAALRLARMTANESRQAGDQHRVSLVSFSDQGQLLQSFSTDLPAIEASIERLQPDANTNMAGGLRVATDALDAVAGLGRRTLILLSDGIPTSADDPNYSLDPKQELREVYVPRLQTSADCVYVVGLGEPAESGSILSIFGLGGSIDEPFLQELAAAKPDCGGYYAATDAGQLAASFLRSRHLSTGGELVIDAVDQSIAQGETTAAVELVVPRGSGDLNLTLDWPGSQLDLLLTDPRGRVVQPGYKGAELFTDAPPVQAIVRNPLPGKWTASVFGRDVPTGQTQYSLIGSVRRGSPESEPSGAPLFVLLALGLGVLYFVMPGASGGAARPIQGRLILHGPQGVRSVPVSGGPLVIGRSGCDVVVLDPRVSRRHARLQTEGAVISIQDLGSANGTWVNGRRIQQATALRSGDRLRFGNIEAEWQQDAPGARTD